MDLAGLQPLLDWISQHPALAGVVVFSVAAAESLALVGIVVPGIVFMLGVGALVGLGSLDFWATVAWAAAGAVAGDGVSYWLGRHFDKQLRALWPLSKHPQLIPRGEQFFHKHGGKSVLFGRFIGPIRPIILAVAGIMHMNPYHFYFVNILSAVLWAPVVLLPGVVFGSSLHLATAVAGRLVLLIVIVVSLVWLLVVAIRTVVNPLLLKLFGRWESHWDFVVRNAFNSAVVMTVLISSTGAYYAYLGWRQAHLEPPPLDDKQQWWQEAWQQLPAYRDQSDQQDPFVMQWWADAKAITDALHQGGWQPANRLSLQNTIMWLSPEPQIETLPLLSKNYSGDREGFLWVRKLDEDRQLVLRLWPAYRKNASKGKQSIPLWLGTVSQLELKQFYTKVFYPHISNFIDVSQRLPLLLPTTVQLKSVARPITADGWDGQVLLLQ